MASSVASSGESTRDTWTPMPRRFPSNIATFDPSRVFLIDPVIHKTRRQSNRPYGSIKYILTRHGAHPDVLSLAAAKVEGSGEPGGGASDDASPVRHSLAIVRSSEEIAD